MNDNEKIRRLLELLDQREQISEEDVELLLQDDEMRMLYNELVSAKRAMVNADVADDEQMVAEAWRDFSEKHPETHAPQRQWMRMAAMIAAILLVSGVVIASVYQIRNRQSTQQISSQPVAEAQTHARDTVFTQKPTEMRDSVGRESVVFDNVTLEKMLQDIATFHHKNVVFQQDKARQLRFYFIWQKERPLSDVIQSLNHFESLQIALENEQIIVR